VPCASDIGVRRLYPSRNKRCQGVRPTRRIKFWKRASLRSAS
jgi:hypothetical protein